MDRKTRVYLVGRVAGVLRPLYSTRTTAVIPFCVCHCVYNLMHRNNCAISWRESQLFTCLALSLFYVACVHESAGIALWCPVQPSLCNVSSVLIRPLNWVNISQLNSVHKIENKETSFLHLIHKNKTNECQSTALVQEIVCNKLLQITQKLLIVSPYPDVNSMKY